MTIWRKSVAHFLISLVTGALWAMESTEENKPSSEPFFLPSHCVTLDGHTNWVLRGSFSPDSKTLITQSVSGPIRVWDVPSGKPRFTIDHDDVFSAVFSPDGNTIVTPSKDKTAKIWDAKDGRLRLTLSGHNDDVVLALFSPNGQSILTSSDGALRIWDSQAGELQATWTGHNSESSSAMFSSNGKYLVTGFRDSIAKVWDVQTGSCLMTITGNIGCVLSAKFSADGKLIATASRDKVLLSSMEENPKRLERAHDISNELLSFSPDGKLLALVRYNDALITDTQTGAVLFTLRGHTSSLSAIEFSPDGHFILTGSLDGTACVWDASNGTQLFTLRGHQKGIRWARFSPDGKFIATTACDNKAKLWRFPVELMKPTNLLESALAVLLITYLPIYLDEENDEYSLTGFLDFLCKGEKNIAPKLIEEILDRLVLLDYLNALIQEKSRPASDPVEALNERHQKKPHYLLSIVLYPCSALGCGT